MERVELEIHVAEGVTRRVTRDGQGLVTVFEADGSEVAQARWIEDKLDEKRVVKGAISRGQWGQIEGRLRSIEHRAELVKLQAGGDYLNFLLDPNNDTPPTPVLSVVKLVPGSWKVRVDRSGLLVITELAGDRLRVVATANYLPTRLRAKQIKNGSVSKEQWARVHAAVTTVKEQRDTTPTITPAVVSTTPDLTFLLDLADCDDDRIVEGSLTFTTSGEKPTGAFVWKVSLDTKGEVRIYSLGMKDVGHARWAGTLVDRHQVTSQVPTDYQWALVERALLLALERRAEDGSPPARVVEQAPLPPMPPIPSPNYRAFLLDIREGTVVDNSVRFSPDPALVPERAFVWEVTLDGSTIRVEDWEGDRLATGSWSKGLTDTAQAGSIPTDAQWRMVRKALERVAGIPDDTGRTSGQAYVPTKSPPMKKKRISLAIALLAASIVVPLVVLVVIVWRETRSDDRAATAPVAIQPPERPSPPPPPPPPPPPLPPETFATRLAEHRLRWADVAVPPETTIEQAEKEPLDETGKRLCIEGTIENITRADRGSQRFYSGAVTTKSGDRVTFVVGGTTGQIVKRSSVTLCGVMTGFVDGAVAVEGLFDLPENRNPIVEKD